MARPKTKEELLNLSQENFNKLLQLVASFSDAQKHEAFSFEHRDKNIRDVLAHLHEWHLMMFSWYEIGMGGEKPKMPAEGYTWKTLPELNYKIWEKYQNTSLDKINLDLKNSYEKIRQLIVQHSNEELFEKKRYHWTGSTSLGAYLISNTSSHYDWAIKWLKKHKRESKFT